MERGEKHTGVKHLSMEQFKNVARYYDRQAYNGKKKIEQQYWKIKGSLQKSKKKALTDKVIIDGEIYHILLDFLDMYSEEIQNMVTSRAFVESLNEFFREILLSNDKKKKEKTIDILK